MAAKPDKATALRNLVEEQLPNFRFVERVTADSPAQRTVADAVTPDLETLRRKFLGQDSPATRRRRARPAAEPAPVTDAGEHADIVLVEPKNARSRDRGAGAKTVVISKGEIIGMQG